MRARVKWGRCQSLGGLPFRGSPGDGSTGGGQVVATILINLGENRLRGRRLKGKEKKKFKAREKREGRARREGSVLSYAPLDPIREPAKCFKFFSDKHCMQVATSTTFPSANDVIDLCWILYNKPGIVATFFFQRTTAFELFFFHSTYLHFRFLVLGKQKLKISELSRPDLFDG